MANSHSKSRAANAATHSRFPPSSTNVESSSDSENVSETGLLSDTSTPSHYASSETLSTTEDSWSVILDEDGLPSEPAPTTPERTRKTDEDDSNSNKETPVDSEVADTPKASDQNETANEDQSMSFTAKNSISTLKEDSTAQFDMRGIAGSNHEDSPTIGSKGTSLDTPLEPKLQPKSQSFSAIVANVKAFVFQHKVLSASLVFVVVGSLLEASTSSINDYMWRRSIVNKSVPVYDIPVNDKYVQLYVDTCTSTAQKLDDKLHRCIDNGYKFKSNRYIGHCFSEYAEDLRKDSEFCDFNVEKMVLQASVKYSKDYANLLANSAAVVAAEYRRSLQDLGNTFLRTASKRSKEYYDSTNAFLRNDLPKFRGQLSQQIRYLHNRYIRSAQQQVLDGTAILYYGYAVPGYERLVVQGNDFYHEYLITAGNTAKSFFETKVKPTTARVYSSIQSVPFQDYWDNALQRQAAWRNASLDRFNDLLRRFNAF
ncbi:DEKNAAC101264 [Brettanomyces naardenensis]|uniref:DEKNAAC101264 n=1 Tax=Brettanomyces naardenensis TaxID=13370 RepID=A0A448YHT4_BRENA|nr:DEKNAAC101264 [Brettanomyces naardenensis]